MKIAYWGIIQALLIFTSCTIQDTIPERNTFAPDIDTEHIGEGTLSSLENSGESSESIAEGVQQSDNDLSSPGKELYLSSEEVATESSQNSSSLSGSSASFSSSSSAQSSDARSSSITLSSQLSQSSNTRSSSSTAPSSTISSSSLMPSSSSEAVLDLSGNLNVTFKTVTYNGSYALKGKGHVYALYIVAENGAYIKTLESIGKREEDNLVNWMNALGGLSIDGVSGATTTVHNKRNVDWDLKDRDGNTVFPGTYTLYMEFTEDNKSGTTFKGRIYSIDIELTGKAFTITDSHDNFNDISITYTP